MRLSSLKILLITILFVQSICYGQEKSDTISDTVKIAESGYMVSLNSDYESGIIHEKSLKERILVYYQNSGIFYRAIIFINIYFILSSIFLSIILLLRRMYGLVIKFKIRKCSEKYRDYITEWLYTEEAISVPEYIIRDMKSRNKREVFTKELLSLHSNLIGESAKKLVELFNCAGLKKYSIKKIKSRFWHIKAKGFRELAQMNIVEGNKMIYKYLNSKNNVLRLEAQLAWIQLNPDNPYSFYDFPNIQVTKWGQLNSLEVLKKIGIVPDFGKWLQNSNKNITIFALRMTGVFKQFDSNEAVSSLLSDKDSEIRREAIITLGKMEITVSADELRNLYCKEDIPNKTEIVRALIMISDVASNSFFKNIILNETDNTLRILASKGLLLSGGNGIDIINEILFQADPVLTSIIKHAKCL